MLRKEQRQEVKEALVVIDKEIDDWFITEVTNRARGTDNGFETILRFMINYPLVGMTPSRFHILVNMMSIDNLMVSEKYPNRTSFQRFKSMYVAITMNMSIAALRELQKRFVNTIVHNGVGLTKRDVGMALKKAPAILLYPILQKALMRHYSTVYGKLDIFDKEPERG
jgi:hypothetical protein